MLNTSHDKSIVFCILHALMSHTGGDMTQEPITYTVDGNTITFDNLPKNVNLSTDIAGLTIIPQGARAESKPLNDNFLYLNVRADNLKSEIDGVKESLDNDVDTKTQEYLDDKFYSIVTVRNLEGSLKLKTNTTYSVTPLYDGDGISFDLTETDLDNTEFNQILVQLKLEQTRHINHNSLGTDKFFDGNAPSFGRVGTYDIIYQYDNLNQRWCCGALYMGAS